MFSGSGWTLVKVQSVFAEGIEKVKEGGLFFSRGVRLLGSDMSSAGRLFSRAVLGKSSCSDKLFSSVNSVRTVFGSLRISFVQEKKRKKNRCARVVEDQA